MARVSSASDIQDTLPAMIAFKWEASPGKPLKEASISEATFCPSLEYRLQPPPGRRTEEKPFTRASASKASKNIAGSLRTKLFHVELESPKQEDSLSPFKLASGRSLKDGGEKTRHMGYKTPNYPNPLGGAASNRETKGLGKLVEKLHNFSFSGEAAIAVEDPPLDSLQLPPGKRPNDGFYLQYPRPLAVVKVNPASEVLKSGRALVQKRLKKILGMERKPSTAVKSLPSDDAEREAPVRIDDLPESDVGSSNRCSAVNMTCNNLEGLHMKHSLIGHCFSDLGSKMLKKGRREGGLSESDKEGGSTITNFEHSKDKVDGYGGPISRKSSRRNYNGSHLAKCFPFDGSSKVFNKRGEDGDTDTYEEGDQNTTTESPAFSRTSSPNCRGSKHGLRSCLSLPRRRTPSCQLMATMLMSLFPLKYDMDSDEEPNVAVSECHSNQTQRHQPEEQEILVSSSPPIGTGIQLKVAEESSPRSSLDEYHPDNNALKSVSLRKAANRRGERGSSVQTLESSFLRKSCLQTNFDHGSAGTSVSDYDHLHTLEDSKPPLHGAQQKSAAWRSSEKPHKSTILRCTSLETEVEYYSPGSSSSSSSDSEHPPNLTFFQDLTQQKLPGRPLKNTLKPSSSKKPSMSRRAVEPSSLNFEGSPVPNFVWSPILQLKDEETSAMRNSPQGKLRVSYSARGKPTHHNGEQEFSPCNEVCKEHQNRPVSQLNTRPQIVATRRPSSQVKFTSESDSLRKKFMRMRIENDSTSSRSNGENKIRNSVSDPTFKLSRDKLELKQPTPSLKICDDECAKIMAGTKSHLHRLKPELQLATNTLPAVISGPSEQDLSASCRSAQEEPGSHNFRWEISDESTIPSMLALKPATWTWSTDEIFEDSATGNSSAPPDKLQQQNSCSLAEENMLQAHRKWISRPSSSLSFNPSAPSSAITSHVTNVMSSPSSLQRSPSHVRHDELENLRCSSRSSVISMVARWECKAGAGEASSKSAPLHWHGRWTLDS